MPQTRIPSQIFKRSASIYAVAVSGQRKVWTYSIAGGSKAFIENLKARLRLRAKGRDAIEAVESWGRSQFLKYILFVVVRKETMKNKLNTDMA